MCYSNIKTVKSPRKKFYWRVVNTDVKDVYRGVYTLEPLPVNKWKFSLLYF